MGAREQPLAHLVRRARGRALRATGGFSPEVLIFDLTHRCNSRCSGCGFREAEPGELSDEAWLGLAEEGRKIGFQSILLTGGEPLTRPGLIGLVKQLPLPVDLHSNGLLLVRKQTIFPLLRMLYVSLDTLSTEVYRQIRGVDLSPVLAGLRLARGKVSVHLRTTIWPANAASLVEVADYAAANDFKISFLAADLTSTAFGERGEQPRVRVPGGPLRGVFEQLAVHPAVDQSPGSLRRTLALAIGEKAPPPQCLAPWTSGVIGPTGGWHPCFFLGAAGGVEDGLLRVIQRARAGRRAIRPATNPTCLQCVCWRG